MILILSESSDVSTDYVIEWLHYFDIPFMRINEGEQKNTLVSIEFKDGRQKITFRFKGVIIDIDQVEGVWFRRGLFSFPSEYARIDSEHNAISQQVVKLLNIEQKTLADFICLKLGCKRSINNQLNYSCNKLEVLLHAQSVGLCIPHTAITTDIPSVVSILNKTKEEIITKPIQDIFWLNDKGTSAAQFTTALSEYDHIPEHFYYSLFQEKINKKFELRIFFLNTDFYASAIFTKNIDGRHDIVNEKMARIVPYNIPDKLRTQLIELNQLCKLNSGSIDMIVDEDDNHYFLEVNPVGQYGHMGRQCNYHLHQKIAKFFLHEKEII